MNSVNIRPIPPTESNSLQSQHLPSSSISNNLGYNKICVGKTPQRRGCFCNVFHKVVDWAHGNCRRSCVARTFPVASSATNEHLSDIQKQQLKSLTIDPKVANDTMKYIKYDGFGKIQDIINPIPYEKVNLLLNSVITPLTELPVKRSEESKITPTEALIDLYSAVNNDSTISHEQKEPIFTFIKCLFFKGDTTNSILSHTINHIKNHISPLPPHLENEIKFIGSRVSTVKHITKINDNYYGRTFDSALATYIVKHETPYIKEQVSIIANELLFDFKKQSAVLPWKNSQKKICASIQNLLNSDYAPWINSIPEALSFLKNPTPNNFRTMMQIKPTASFRSDLILSIAVKYIRSSPGYAELKNNWSELYSNVISHQRKFIPINNSSSKFSTKHGITLSYQKIIKISTVKFKKNPQLGVRPIDIYKSNVEKITEHNQLAHNKGRAVGIGMSGSANLLNGLFHKIKNENSNFSIKTAQLVSAAHLTFSGGHSINEAFTTFNYLNSKRFNPISYSDLMRNLESPEVKALFNAATEQAFNAMVEASKYVNI